MSKRSHFRGSFNKKDGKRVETLLKSERQHLYHIYWSLWMQFRLKKSFSVRCKILGLFVNPLSADNKYSLLNRGNLMQHVKMQLCQKWKSFAEFFFLHFVNLDSILNIFKKKDDPHSWCIFEITDSEKCG